MLSGALKRRTRVFHSAVRRKPAAFASKCSEAAPHWCFYTQVACSNQKLTLPHANPAKQPSCEMPPALVHTLPNLPTGFWSCSAPSERRLFRLQSAQTPGTTDPPGAPGRFPPRLPLTRTRTGLTVPTASRRGTPPSPPGLHREVLLRFRSGRDARAAPEVTGGDRGQRGRRRGAQRLRTRRPHSPNRQLTGRGGGRGSSSVRAASARCDWLRARWREIRLAAARGGVALG